LGRMSGRSAEVSRLICGAAIDGTFTATQSPQQTSSLIHVDDILRPLGVTRGRPPDEETAFAALRTVARWQFRMLKTDGSLAISTRAGRSLTVISGFMVPRVSNGVILNADARLSGDVVALMTFLTGRDSVVTVEGDGPLATALRRPMPTV